MRALAYLMVLIFADSCAHVTNKAVNYAEPLDTQAQSGSILKDEGDKYYVPKIKFDTDVNEESVFQTMTLMSGVLEAGAQAVIIEWNTPGGSIDAGFRLARAIEESPIPVICVVDGDAASMGMYLLQSCDVRIMTKRSTLMVHEAAIGVPSFYGHEVSWENIAARLRAMNAAMAEHIGGRMHIKPEWILNRIRGGSQWWINWEEALKVEGVDMVVSSVKEVTDAYRQNFEAPKSALTQSPQP